MPKIIFKIDLEKDAWNWWDAGNKISYGENWKERVGKKLQAKIVGKSKSQAFKFLKPYLKSLYKKIKIRIQLAEVKKIFAEKSEEIFSRMEKLTNKKIYRKNFTCFLTTFPRAPYDYQRGYVWLPIVWPKQTYIRIFVHELLHFQTYAYWEKKCLKKLNREEFENLKEALTVVLNAEFLDLITWPDKGYLMHVGLRKKLLKFWNKNRNFGKLIEYGISIYPKGI